MSIIIYLIAAPTIGVLWFLNFITFLKKLKNNKDTHNQVILGSVLTFLLLFVLIVSILMIFESSTQF